ncbi:MAG TPA: rhomboid family intramembrane serine protease [Solirubrobacteraceae bacterium]|nr:rhomboid family intramembrane serine protease [Solirubrobacteraceae bacterium]
MSSPDLFVVCKNCQAEVSPYITECPYCGTRLRKRAPKIDRPDATAKPSQREGRIGRRGSRRDEGERAARPKPRAKPKPKPPKAEKRGLGRLRSGEIPGIRGEDDRRPYATMVLVALSFGLWLSLAFYVRADFAVMAFDGDPWRFLTASLLNEGIGAQFAAVVGLGLFGWLIERRHGPIAVVVLFLLCGPGGLAAAAAVDPNTVVFGAHGAGLGLLCAWLVPVLIARSRGDEDEADLLGVLVIAAVLLLVPLLSQGSALGGLFGGAFGAIAGFALAAVRRGR